MNHAIWEKNNLFIIRAMFLELHDAYFFFHWHQFPRIIICLLKNCDSVGPQLLCFPSILWIHFSVPNFFLVFRILFVSVKCTNYRISFSRVSFKKRWCWCCKFKSWNQLKEHYIFKFNSHSKISFFSLIHILNEHKTLTQFILWIWCNHQ